ncbi:hypothetical protein SKAU_G00028050 [Synaphobranchus kaupii]|uniref:Uncharacterized protein n=1 Tax=Synaphobranchus kaupii TaxID=118154 RepID=A0A9Q1GDQ8_SYNKA|nr:hypothetical protein SKAU_G00028050 [Synaphobranchus kaupii]
MQNWRTNPRLSRLFGEEGVGRAVSCESITVPTDWLGLAVPQGRSVRVLVRFMGGVSKQRDFGRRVTAALFSVSSLLHSSASLARHCHTNGQTTPPATRLAD